MKEKKKPTTEAELGKESINASIGTRKMANELAIALSARKGSRVDVYEAVTFAVKEALDKHGLKAKGGV